MLFRVMPPKATLTDCVQVIEEGETGPRPRAQVSSNLTRAQTIISSWPSNDKWRLEGASWQITVVLDSSEVTTLAIILSVLRVVKSALFGRAFQICENFSVGQEQRGLAARVLTKREDEKPKLCSLLPSLDGSHRLKSGPWTPIARRIRM